MRVLSFAIRSLLVIVGLAVVVGLLGREVLLLWATSQLQTDLRTVRQALKDGDYAAACLDKDSIVIEGEQVVVAQLRFRSNTEYQLEIVCTRFLLEPTVIKTTSLPPFVRKVPGSSGIVMGNEFSGIAVEVYGRKRLIYVENQAIKTGGDIKRISIGDGPAAMCSGYGLRCCSLETELGVGESVVGAQDCPLSCHTACVRRPVLLSLTADPYIDFSSKVSTIQEGQLLTVNYSVQPGASSDVTVTMDFGDGTVKQAVTAQGSFDHSYQCSSTTCQFTVRVTVVDGNGVVAAEAVHSSFTVVVHR